MKFFLGYFSQRQDDGNFGEYSTAELQSANKENLTKIPAKEKLSQSILAITKVLRNSEVDKMICVASVL